MAHEFIVSIEKLKVFQIFVFKLQKCNYGTLSRKISSVGSISRVASPYRPLLWQNRILMSGSCHFDRASNNKFGVEFWMFVFVMFLGHLQGIIRGPLLKRDNFELIWTSFRSDIYVGWKKNQNKHSKFDNKFVIGCPVEMTWSAPKWKTLSIFTQMVL